MNTGLLDYDIIVLGCGNALYGDDAFGGLVIEKLKKEYESSGVGHIDAGTGGPRLLNLLNERAAPPRVIIVDTAKMGNMPGTVSVIRPSNIPYMVGKETTHGMDLVQEIGKYRGECILVLGEPYDLSFGETPSRQVLDSIDNAASVVDELVGRLMD